MFWEKIDYTYLAEWKTDANLSLPQTVRIPIDLYDPKKPWKLYNTEQKVIYQANGRFTESKIIDIKTPKFSNLRWMLKTRDYPDGEIFSVLLGGLLRGKQTSVILVGDWHNQSFDLSNFVKTLPETLKQYEGNIHCYNSKDLSFLDDL
jgi:hypothetical protein